MAHFLNATNIAVPPLRNRVLLRAAALLALGCAPLVFSADAEPDFPKPKPQKSDNDEKPKKSKLVKNEYGGWQDSAYQPVDSFGKVDSGKNTGKMMGADEGLSPEEMYAKYLKNLQDQQEKMKKLQQDMEKKQAKQKKQQEKDQKDGKPNSREIVIPGDGSKVLNWEEFQKGKDRGPRVIEPTKSGSVNRTIEMGSSSGKKTSLTDRSGDGVQALTPGSKAIPFKTEPRERSWWDKLTGQNKEETVKLNLDDNSDGKLTVSGSEKGKAADGSTADTFKPRPAEYRSTATQRLANIMERRRMENGPVAGENKPTEESGKETSSKDFEAKKAAALAAAADAGAEIVDLGDKKESAKSTQLDPVAAQSPTPIPEPDRAQAIDTNALPETEYDTQADAERAYQNGLRAKDIVIREAAYQRAAWERRVDAVPFLQEEVKLSAPLAVLAAEALGVLPFNESTEALLLKELVGYDPLLRKASAESLGRMRSRRALAVLADRIRPDRTPKARFPFVEPSLPARSACVDALGAIGEREAIPVLKSKLEEASEIEFVKSRAALALARLGDPSGRAHLIKNLDSTSPALQVVGIQGLSQLGDSGVAPYLGAALESRHDEVWSTAIILFPRLGAANALPLLRQRLENGNEITRRRAALAMGYLGSDEGILYIDRAVRYGSIAERVMGCELMALLARTDCAPLLIEKLQDPSGNVRMNAAMALTRMNITEAAGAITEASRARANQNDLPPWMRNNGPDVYERLVMLSCVRVLRGEKDDLVITTLPNMRDNTWPEVDRVMAGQQNDLLKMYEFVDVISTGNQAIGVVLKTPSGQEMTYRQGEAVAGGYRVRDIGLPPVNPAANQKGLTAYVTLVKGDERITLAPGREPSFDSLRKKDK